MTPEVLGKIVLGIPLTVGLTAAALAIGVALGLPLALVLRSHHWWWRVPVRIVVDFLRAVPILVWLFLLYFVISIGSFHFDRWQASIIALGLVSAAYLAEVFRTAIASVDRGQWEAAKALGLSSRRAFAQVIAPQAARIALPSSTTFALTLLKDSAIPSAIGVMEIAYQTTAIARSTGSGLLAYGGAVIFYTALSVPIATLARYLDRRLRTRQQVLA